MMVICYNLIAAQACFPAFLQPPSAMRPNGAARKVFRDSRQQLHDLGDQAALAVPEVLTTISHARSGKAKNLSGSYRFGQVEQWLTDRKGAVEMHQPRPLRGAFHHADR